MLSSGRPLALPSAWTPVYDRLAAAMLPLGQRSRGNSRAIHASLPTFRRLVPHPFRRWVALLCIFGNLIPKLFAPSPLVHGQSTHIDKGPFSFVSFGSFVSFVSFVSFLCASGSSGLVHFGWLYVPAVCTFRKEKSYIGVGSHGRAAQGIFSVVLEMVFFFFFLA